MLIPWFPVMPVPVIPWQIPPVLPRRYALLGQPAMPAIEPLYGFFAGGHAIGGPTGEGFRGVSASSFPLFESVLGSGGPLSESATGLAGQRMFLPGIHGEPWP